VSGLGLGLTLPASLDVALGALTPERSGVGNALLQAMRQVGGAIGVAVLGTVLNAGYRDRLPGQTAGAVRDSAAAGVAVAERLGDTALLDSVRSAFVHGMDLSLVVAGSVALAGTVLTLIFMPGGRPESPAMEKPAPVLAESGL